MRIDPSMILSFRIKILLLLVSLVFQCAGKKSLGNFETIVISKGIPDIFPNANRQKEIYCDRSFFFMWQISMISGEQNPIEFALRNAQLKNKKIDHFLDVTTKHEFGCWEVEFTPVEKI
jgi:hypothetical protein